ncbi:MAG: hypothetical protein COW30_18035 [Rhodospirillales bacterium CG15_BIG_FIL_POST_REV_8_21_14_020_66_15]|nr:MAG: hypothetical protein COW30_18035 [Rhodospirillales bacterium CG15_BIG_FIL_POST_REV_8_21_14_020_66_15]
METLKSVTSIFIRTFGPLGFLFGGVLTMMGEWAVLLFGEGPFSTFLQGNGERIGFTLFIFCGLIMVLRMEWRFREHEEYFGNEAQKKLWRMGILPTRDYYLNYVREGDYGVVNRFWEAGTVNVNNGRGRWDIHIACEAGHAAIVQGLLERGVDPKITDQDGFTPLMTAVRFKHSKIIDLLLHHDCALNTKSSKQGCSALFVAAVHHDEPEIAATLLAHGAEIESVDHNNLTPLMAAVAQQRWKVASLLIDRGADANRVDGSGATLMDYTALYNAPREFVARLEGLGIKKSPLNLKRVSGGFSAPAGITIKWEAQPNVTG